MSPPRTFEQLMLCVLLYGGFAALGGVGTVAILYVLVWPQWRANNVFVQTEGLVVDQREVPWESSSLPQVRIRYQVSGVELEHWNGEVGTFGMDEGTARQRVREMAVGQRQPVWYDPADPEVVLVERGYWIPWPIYPLLAGTAFFLLYGIAKLAGSIRSWSRSRPGHKRGREWVGNR